MGPGGGGISNAGDTLLTSDYLHHPYFVGSKCESICYTFMKVFIPTFDTIICSSVRVRTLAGLRSDFTPSQKHLLKNTFSLPFTWTAILLLP